MGERGALVEARQLAGLLRAGGRNAGRGEASLTRLAQLAARNSAGKEPADAARACAALRDVVLDLCERRAIDIGDARALCRTIDAAEAEALETFNGSHRARHALRTFESLIETSPLPIVSTDRRGRVRIWNPPPKSSSAGSAARCWGSRSRSSPRRVSANRAKSSR